MKRLVWIIPLALVIGLIVRSRSGKKTTQPGGPPANQPTPVEVAPVRVGRMDRTLAITGNIKVDEEVNISAKASGRVRGVSAREGDHVRRGQMLVSLDDAELRAQVRLAQATLRSARARLAQLRAGRGMRSSQTNTRIAQAQANLDAAKVRVSQLGTQAQITETQTSAQVLEAEAALAAAKQRLALMQEGSRKQEKTQGQLAVNQAKANYDNAKAYYDRRQQLYQSGAISKEMVDEAERQFKVAEAQYQSAQAQSDLVQEGFRTQEVQMAEEDVRKVEEAVRQARANVNSYKIRKEDIDAAKIQVKQAVADLENATAGMADIQVTQEEIRGAEAGVQQAEATVSLANEQLSNARIVSPVNAVVVSRMVHAGEMASPGMPLMKIVALDTAYFEGVVSEVDIHNVTPDLPVKVTIDSMPGSTFAGQVRSIIPTAGSANRSFKVRISIPLTTTGPANQTIKPGSFARGNLILSTTPDARIVPATAIVKRDSTNVVYVFEANMARERQVEVGVVRDEEAQIVTGVEAGESVVVSGADTLQDKAKVRIVTRDKTD